MNCTQCGRALPDDAKFCSGCGHPVAAAPAPPPPPPASVDPTQPIKCPSCGAPLKPVFGEMVISCDYCGGSVTLGAGGWKEINKHTMLPVKLVAPDSPLGALQAYLDQGFLHHHAFEESKVVETRLTFVPFWVIPVSATTTFQYQSVAAGVGGTVGSIAAAEVLGAALGGARRGGGGFIPIPVVMGSPVNATRADTISSQYEFPVVAVKAMSAYQPKDYKFEMASRTFFDRKGVPTGTQVLNGDLGEDAAQHAARAFVAQLQADEAHHKHSMVSNLQTQTDVSEGELLHVPIWYVLLERKGERHGVLVDASAGRVIQTISG